MDTTYNPNDFYMIEALALFFGLTYTDVHGLWYDGKFTEDDLKRADNYYSEWQKTHDTAELEGCFV